MIGKSLAGMLIFMRPAGTDFEATFRVLAYTSVVTLFGWIPIVSLLAALSGYYLAFVGIKEMHETITGRALAVVLVPAGLFVTVSIFSFSTPPPERVV